MQELIAQTLLISLDEARIAAVLAERDSALRALEQADAARCAAEDLLRQSRKVAAVGLFASGLAHDFNNLLSVVIGNLDRASRLATVDARTQGCVTDAMTAANRAAALVGKLMVLARRQPATVVEVAVDGLLADLAPLIRALLPGRQTRLDLRCGWSSRIDASQLENAILNLAANARDAMLDGGTLTITSRACISENDPGDRVEIQVQDSGTGMPPEILARVREPFFTTKPAGAGTGLGLSQVAAFAELSGGTMDVESEVGRGTCIRLRLPRA